MVCRRSIRAAIWVLAALALGACARDATTPAQSPAAPNLSVQSSGGRYLVLMKQAGVPADFGAQVAALGGTLTYSHPVGLAEVSGFSAAAARSLARSNDVADVEPDVSVSLDEPAHVVPVAVRDVAASQGNPAGAGLYGWQWNMRLIKADQAWAAGDLGSPDVTVAILDTGIDYDAYDLAGLVDLSRSASFVASDDSITDAYFPTRNAVSDYDGHGTNVATQVSSMAVAFAGVTSRTTLIGVKVLNRAGSGSLGEILAGILWAADQGADVANMSLGGGFAKVAAGPYVASINRAFNYAKQKGMLIVVAAGNELEDLDHNGNELKTFCDQPHVVCVSAVGPAVATDNPDTFSFYSNYGRSAITVAAPGGNLEPVGDSFVYSDWPWGNDFASWVWSLCSRTYIYSLPEGGPPVTPCAAGNYISGYVGTSQATPHVSGLAALLVAQIGHGRPQLVKQMIEKSADDLGQPGTDPYYGRGRINVARALGL